MALSGPQHRVEVLYNHHKDKDRQILLQYVRLDTQELQEIECSVNALPFIEANIHNALEVLAQQGVRPVGDMTVDEHTGLNGEPL